MVILYCLFVAVSPFYSKDGGQTRNFLATLACSLVDKEETRRFFFLTESLSDFGLKILQAHIQPPQGKRAAKLEKRTMRQNSR